MVSAAGARMTGSPAARGRWTMMELKSGPTQLAKPSHSETRHWTPRRYMYGSGIDGDSALSSWSILGIWVRSR